MGLCELGGHRDSEKANTFFCHALPFLRSLQGPQPPEPTFSFPESQNLLPIGLRC